MNLLGFIMKGAFNIIDYTLLKKYGLDHKNIDSTSSYELFDPYTNYNTIHIFLIKEVTTLCPTCGSSSLYSKGSKTRKLNYSTSTQDNITIILHRRVYKCRMCNLHFQEVNPFVNSKRQITLEKEIKILEELRDYNASYTSVAKRMGLSITSVINTFDAKVDISRGFLTPVLCVDEVYSKRLGYTKYCFIIYSPQRKKILDVLDSRKQDVLDSYFSRIPKKERESVLFFSTDLYRNYKILAKKWLPKAIICADSFHVIQNLIKDFQTIRIKVMKRYENMKKDLPNYYWLYKRYWKLLLKDNTKLRFDKFYVGKSRSYLSESEIVDYMLDLDTTLKTAYYLKQDYMDFNNSCTIEDAAEVLDELTLRFANSNIKEYKRFVGILKSWRNEIINSFNTINGYRISNGPMERVNRDIKSLFRVSFGSTNFQRVRNRILYSINSNSSFLYTRKNISNKIPGKKRGTYKK